MEDIKNNAKNTFLTKMPGFRLTWFYTSTGNVKLTPHGKFWKSVSRQEFERKDFN